MAVDIFQNNLSGLQSPGLHAAAITPNDGADLSQATRAIFVGGAGTLKVTMQGGETVTLTGVVAGTTLAIRVARVWNTGTTCTNLTAFW